MSSGGICDTHGVDEPAGHYGRRLRAARTHAGLTQYELAERSGVNLESIRKHEHRVTPPRDLTLVQALEHALGVRLVNDEREDVKVIGRGFSVESLTKADAQALTRALSAKLASEADARAEAVPLVWKLCRGEGSEWDRRRWAKQVADALSGESRSRRPDIGAAAVTEDDAATPYGAGFDYVGPEVSPSTVDAEKPGDDSAEA